MIYKKDMVQATELKHFFGKSNEIVVKHVNTGS